jgi:hypothetical protein
VACVANCHTCTGTTVALCSRTNNGWYKNGAVISMCDTRFSVCKDAGTVYAGLEVCAIGSDSYFAGPWTAACKVAPLPTLCTNTFHDGTATKCAKCTGANYLTPATYVCSATCAATDLAITGITYKIFGITYNGNVCLPPLAHVLTADNLYMYNVNTCADGYYVFKTDSFIANYNALGPDFELILCGKCHDECLTCFDFSRHACVTCPVGKVLYMSTCIATCPAGYTPDVSQVCQVSACPALTYTYITAGPTTNCVKKCPLGFFANNSTWNCDACNPACTDCWGPAATDCRLCAAGVPTGLGTCTTCAALTYPDAFESFLCAPFSNFNYMNNMAASAPNTDPALTGVVYRVKTTSVAQVISVNAQSYVEILSNDRELVIPTITYPNTRICYRYLVQFDLSFTTHTNWHNKNIIVSDAATVIKTIPINRWDFETALATYNPSFELNQVKVFAENTKCTKTTLDLKFESDLAAPATWGVKNLNVYWFQCPVDCIDCLTSISCRQCVEGKFFFPLTNLCNVPYTTLVTDPVGLVETYAFLFRPNSVFLFFNKPMNFNLGDLFPYFFPTFVPAPAARLLQPATYQPADVNTLFIGNNMMELKVDKLETPAKLRGSYTFRYPLVDAAGTGYAFTTIPVEYETNSYVKTLVNDYVQVLVNNKVIFRYVLTGVSLVLIYAYGANWFMIENCQKLYLLLFLGMNLSRDWEGFLQLMDFSFFGWFQELHTMLLGPSSYWDYTSYDIYLSRSDKTAPISKDFLEYIPQFKMGKYLVRKSFLVHAINLLLIFAAMIGFHLINLPIRCLILKKYHYKPTLVAITNTIHNFLNLKFFVRFICLTFVPFVFYGLGNFSKMVYDIPAGMISTYTMFGVGGLYGLALLVFYVFAILMPNETELKTLSSGFKVTVVIPFRHFMEYYKHPDTAIDLKGIEDDEENKNKDFGNRENENLVIKENLVEANVFTLLKEELKNRGARVFKLEKPIDPKEAKLKKKKPEVFIPVSKVLEMEEKEREAKKKEKEEKESSSEEENEKGKSDDEDKKEEKEGEKKPDEKEGQNASDSDDSDGDTGDSEEAITQGEDIRNVGKLLSKAVAKVEKTGNCCACKAIRKNKCLNKTNHLLARTSKYFTLFRMVHLGGMSYVLWNFVAQPDLQTIIFAGTQTFVLVWSLLARPYKYILMNISLVIVEGLFTGIAWLLWVLSKNPSDELKELFSFIGLLATVAIFLVSAVTFLGYLIAAIVTVLSSIGAKKDAL